MHPITLVGEQARRRKTRNSNQLGKDWQRADELIVVIGQHAARRGILKKQKTTPKRQNMQKTKHAKDETKIQKKTKTNKKLAIVASSGMW